MSKPTNKTKQSVMNQIAQIILGLICFVFVHGVVYIILFAYALDWFPCGDDFVDDRMQHNVSFFALLGLGAFQIWISRWYVKKSEYPLFGWAGLAPLGLTLFLLLAIGPSGLLKSNYYEDFSPEAWQDVDNRTEQMMRTILKEELFIGMSKNQVVKDLGYPDYYSCQEDSCFVYNSNTIWLPLYLEFNNDVVIRTYVPCID